MAKPTPAAGTELAGGPLNVDAVITLNMFMLRHMVRLYAEFDGDLVAAIVLGEVAHHSLSAYMLAATEARRRGGETHTGSPDRGAYLPTNAFSIAQATGIPRQTVRRKIKMLVDRGWLIEREDGLVVSGLPAAHFRDFNTTLIADAVDTLQSLQGLVKHAAPRTDKRP